MISNALKRLEILRLHGAYNDTFGTPNGQKVLKHLIQKFDGDTFVLGAPDLTIHKQGRRYVVRSILAYMRKDPMDLINEIEKNNKNEE